MHGTEDKTVRPGYSQEIWKLLPEETRRRGRVVWVDGAGHDLCLTHAPRVAGEMWEWFGGKKQDDDEE